ncbi:MAG TPA: dihydroneopterin aldolase [Verrucomicrobiae bacterium]|nr:dihydroneopterin aldolase [Verrucomicrobiae bacterium]
MSKITIVDLELFFHVGVPDEERAQPQKLLATIDMTYDFSSAAVTDRVTKTIDYAEVAQKVTRLGEGRNWKLIEKLATDIADLVLNEFHPEAVTVVVKKFPLPQAGHVSVSVTQTRTSSGTIKRAGWGIP